MRACLNDAERARADRFLQPRHRVQSAVTRGTLRSLLGRYLDRPPQSIDLELNAHGKPALAASHQDSRLRFNVSHSDGLVLLAFTLNRDIGVDIEKIRLDRPFEKIARRFFARGEAAQLCALEPGRQSQAFYECWTRKEAYIKARGLGLSLPLDSFEVGFGPGIPPSLAPVPGNAGNEQTWTVADLRPAEGFAAALVVEAPACVIHCWRLNDE
jgi:4'-phosphopantetheinyl transferase